MAENDTPRKRSAPPKPKHAPLPDMTEVPRTADVAETPNLLQFAPQGQRGRLVERDEDFERTGSILELSTTPTPGGQTAFEEGAVDDYLGPPSDSSANSSSVPFAPKQTTKRTRRRSRSRRDRIGSLDEKTQEELTQVSRLLAAQPAPTAAAAAIPAEGETTELEQLQADPWLTITQHTRKAEWNKAHHKVMLCKEGHTLVEVSTMCDICHGKGENRTTSSASAPVFYCYTCSYILCDECIDTKSCAKLHPSQIRPLQLLCDVCRYTSPFGKEKRKDPKRPFNFITKRHWLEKKKYPEELWGQAEKYQPKAREFYGCRLCDYDICAKCAQARLAEYKTISGSVMVRGSRVHIMSFRVDLFKKVAPLTQLLNQARLAIPAVLNFLYLRRATKRACLYFGRYDAFGNTVGITYTQSGQNPKDSAKVQVTKLRDFSELLRSELLRVMMHDLWPALRVDTPAGDKPLRHVLSSDMQGLVWIKPALPGRVYAKVILQNVTHLYFDNAEAGHDKYRWKNRKLHVRHLDNLETEKAVTSYEIYVKSLKNACRWATHMYSQSLVDFRANHISGSRVRVVDDPAPCSTEVFSQLLPQPSAAPTQYSFAQRLYEPEGTSLDYKSYWVDPMSELFSHVPKFMAGFANAYGSGKLLVGVFEFHRRELYPKGAFPCGEATSPSGTPADTQPKFWRSFSSCPDTYPPEDWLEYRGGEDRVALAVGLSLTKRDLTSLVKGISSSLRSFIPPMPPEWVTLRLIPVKRPVPWRSPAGHTVSLILHSEGEFSTEKTVSTLRALAHRALRTLLPYGLALVPIPNHTYFPKPPPSMQSSLYFVVVRGDSSQAAAHHFADSSLRRYKGAAGWDGDSVKPDWRVALESAMQRASHYCAIVDMKSEPKLPPLNVLEVSVNSDSRVLPTSNLPKPLFFTGWPSIPIWDEVNDVVTKVPKDLQLLERRRVRGTSKHWLHDFTVLQRVCQCYNPFKSVEKKGDWCALMQLRGVSRDFNDTILATTGIQAFKWDSEEHCPVLARRLAIPYTLLTACTAMPAIVKLFFALSGDLPLPHPYRTVPPCARYSTFPVTSTGGEELTVAPLMRRIQPDGRSDILSIVLCVHTARLFCIEDGTITPVTAIVLQPMVAATGVTLTREAEPECEPPCEVSGFKLICQDAPALDLPTFIQWYRSVASDPCVTLTYLDFAGTMIMGPTAEPAFLLTVLSGTKQGPSDAGQEVAASCEDGVSTAFNVPTLCSRHFPQGVEGLGVQQGDSSTCDWHTLEEKWVRNMRKLWRD